MRILFCCEFYAPSVGGVQEVMRQIAERLVKMGHEVTVATTALKARNFSTLNGVQIKEFELSGNFVRGILGNANEYRDYVVQSNFDVMMIKAAQQWTFDALWPVLKDIKTPKVFIPCGFSGLYEPSYQGYFKLMPDILRSFDHLIFYASKYRDIDFAHEHNITHFSVIPNGASEVEFLVDRDFTFRSKNKIDESSFVFLTVGSFTGLKGHLELVKAFSKMKIPEGKHATLILNGNDTLYSHASGFKLFAQFLGVVKAFGVKYAIKHALKIALWKIGIKVGKSKTPQEIAANINDKFVDRRVIVSNFARSDLVQAYMAADLFAFASNVEYSPLVLFEAAASGTPFLTVDVGNSREIATWTGAGIMCESYKDDKGYTRVDEYVLASAMEWAMLDKEKLALLGGAGRRNWQEGYTWGKISHQYEQIFKDIIKKDSN